MAAAGPCVAARPQDPARHAADRRACASRPARPASSTRAAPTSCWPCSTRARRSPASSPGRNARRRRSTGAARNLAGGPGPGAGGQFRQRQRLHGPRRRRGGRPARRRLAAAATGAAPKQIFLASTGVIGEPLDASRFDGRASSGSRPRRPDGRHRGRGARHHDDRHLPEGRDRDGRARRRAGDAQRHRQGRRHDRARHGDHAVLRVHRCADRRARAAGHACRGGRRARSTPSRSTATPRPPTR